MAEERPHEATPARLARARREGDVPRSTQLAAVASVICACAAVIVVLPVLRTALTIVLLDALGRQSVERATYLAIAESCGVVCVAALVGAVVGTLAQTRLFTLRLPVVRLDRLAPSAGFRRIFSRDGLIMVPRLLGAAAAVAVVSVGEVRDVALAGARDGSVATVTAAVWHALGACAFAVCVVGAGFGLLELLSERGRWKRRLRLSAADLKRDLKESDGDPVTRSRQRRAQRSMARSSVERVREAAFVVANPTYVAIALAYDPPRIAVPVVVVRAVDELALTVRRRAQSLGIPVIEDVGAARLLLAATEVDDPIPREAYTIVARIVAEILPASASR